MEKKQIMKLIEGAASIRREIGLIKTAGIKFEMRVHIAACSLLQHIDKHGDMSMVEPLLEALPGLTRKNALRDWFINYGKLQYDGDTKKIVYAKDRSTKLTAAWETPFWEFKPEAAYKPMDLVASVNKIIAEAEKRAKLSKGDRIDPEVLAALKAAMRDRANKPANDPMLVQEPEKASA